MNRYRVVIAAAALAALLWSIVLLTGDGPAPVGDERRRLLEVPLADITAIEVAVGGQTSRLTRRGESFVLEGGSLDPAALSELTAALEYTYSRRLARGRGADPTLGLDSASALDSLRLSSRGGDATVLRRGSTVGGGELAWLGRGQDAVLITASEAASLFLSSDRLRDRRPFRVAAEAVSALELRRANGRALVLGGEPLARRPDGARLDRSALGSLLRDLAKVSVEARPDETDGSRQPDGQTDGGLRIEMTSGGEHRFLRVLRACQRGGWLVDSSVGSGCASGEVFERIERLIANPFPILAGLLDPNRVATAASMTVGAEVVEISPRGPAGQVARDWLAALASASPVIETPVGPSVATIELSFDHGEPDSIELHRDGRGLWAKIDGQPGQPLRWRFSSAAAQTILSARSYQFRERALSSRDPSEVRAVAVGDRRMEGDEIAAPIRSLLAHLEAASFAAARARPEHGLSRPRRRIDVTFAPPPIATGDPDTLDLEIGAETFEDGAADCYARLAGDPVVFVLSAASCRALLSL